MEGAAHSEKFAKRVGVPMKVAKEYVKADKKSGSFKGKKQKEYI